MPDFNLLVIDENDYQDAPLEVNNLVSAIFGFENARDISGLKDLLAAFTAWFNAHPNQALKQSIITWIKHSLKNALSPDILGQVNSLEELSPMFATRAEAFMEQQKNQWLQAGRQEGHQEGRQEGRQEGLQEARQAIEALLIKTLKKRFGQTSESTLSMIESADLNRLDFLMNCALDAESFEDWLKRVRH